MSDLLDLKKKAKALGLCKEYTEKWDNAQNREALFDMGLDAKGIDFMADSCSNGWGLTADFIKDTFPDFINGNRQRNKGGYTSEIYVDYDKPITLRSTLTLLVDCKCTVFVPQHRLGEIYVSGKSDVNVKCDGNCTVMQYGSQCNVSVGGKGIVHKKIIPNAEPHINHNYKK